AGRGRCHLPDRRAHRRCPGPAAQRARLGRRWRQHDGRHRHRQRHLGRAEHEPGHLGHAVRVLRPRHGRRCRPLGRVLRFHLVLAGATLPVAARMGDALALPRNVGVTAGGGGNTMAAIGTGNVSSGVLSMSLGTSGTLFAYSGRAMRDGAGRWAAFCDSTGGWLPLICTMNCTVATEAVGKLCSFSTREGDALLAGTRPGADGLLMLPFLNGERTPNLPNGRGSLFGVTATNFSVANLYRAAMEGAVYSLKNGYDAFVDAGMRFEAIRLTGGGSHSAVWRQMVADVFGLPVDVPEQAEGAAFGAALQALWATTRAQGGNADLAALAAAHVRLEPRLSAHPRAEATAASAAQSASFLSHLGAIRPLYA